MSSSRSSHCHAISHSHAISQSSTHLLVDFVANPSPGGFRGQPISWSSWLRLAIAMAGRNCRPPPAPPRCAAIYGKMGRWPLPLSLPHELSFLLYLEDCSNKSIAIRTCDWEDFLQAANGLLWYIHSTWNISGEGFSKGLDWLFSNIDQQGLRLGMIVALGSTWICGCIGDP